MSATAIFAAVPSALPMLFRQIHDPHLSQYAYLIACQRTKEALIIDPERDIDRYVEAADEEGVTIRHVAETHIHADFLSGARQFAADHDVRLYLSDEGAPDWRYEWALAGDHDVQFLRDGDSFHVGNIKITARHTPGHTPEHLTFLITDEGGGADRPMGIISGDFVFVGDLGRPDLLESAAGETQAAEPAARDLYRSAQQLEELKDYLQVWPGHGAGSACGKALGAIPQTTLGYERQFNDALRAASGDADSFVRTILEGQPEPPLYFARMKRENRQGPALLSVLPDPPPLALRDLTPLAEGDGTTVIDTRPRQTYMRGHLPGSILAPLDQSFPTIAGSYVGPGEPIVLVCEEAAVEDAVRDLVRVGLDDIRGYVTPDVLIAWGKEHGGLRMLKAIDFDEVDGRRHYTNVLVVDVRRKEEWQRKHIPGAFHVPHVRLLERIDELPRDRTLLVHCQSGVRSAVAAAFLHNRGFCVAYVDDHFDRWRERHREEGAVAGTH
jgi:hydroxyacylglutathione hydrolase